MTRTGERVLVAYLLIRLIPVYLWPPVAFRARRQAAKAPDCKSGTREFESHRALQIKNVL
jgi:hypothetical protein